MSREAAKEQYTRKPDDPTRGFVSAADAQTAIDIMYEVGLLFGVGAWAGRAVEVSLDNTGFQGILPLGFAVTMAGLYVAETSNRWDVV